MNGSKQTHVMNHSAWFVRTQTYLNLVNQNHFGCLNLRAPALSGIALSEWSGSIFWSIECEIILHWGFAIFPLPLDWLVKCCGSYRSWIKAIHTLGQSSQQRNIGFVAVLAGCHNCAWAVQHELDRISITRLL